RGEGGGQGAGLPARPSAAAGRGACAPRGGGERGGQVLGGELCDDARRRRHPTQSEEQQLASRVGGGAETTTPGPLASGPGVVGAPSLRDDHWQVSVSLGTGSPSGFAAAPSVAALGQRPASA